PGMPGIRNRRRAVRCDGIEVNLIALGKVQQGIKWPDSFWIIKSQAPMQRQTEKRFDSFAHFWRNAAQANRRNHKIRRLAIVFPEVLVDDQFHRASARRQRLWKTKAFAKMFV